MGEQRKALKSFKQHLLSARESLIKLSSSIHDNRGQTKTNLNLKEGMETIARVIPSIAAGFEAVRNVADFADSTDDARVDLTTDYQELRGKVTALEEQQVTTEKKAEILSGLNEFLLENQGFREELASLILGTTRREGTPAAGPSTGPKITPQKGDKRAVNKDGTIHATKQAELDVSLLIVYPPTIL